MIRCSIPFARVDEATPTVRVTRTIPVQWVFWDAVAAAVSRAALVEVYLEAEIARLRQERDQAMAEVARLAARVAVLEADRGE